MVLVAGVKEEFRVLDFLHDVASGVDVAFADEERVVFHAVELGPGRRWTGIESRREGTQYLLEQIAANLPD